MTSRRWLFAGQLGARFLDLRVDTAGEALRQVAQERARGDGPP